MSQRFLKETGAAATRPLTVGRHQVHDSWDQIQAYLTSVLSPAHANLFAEPYRGADATSWMSRSAAEPVAFARLSPEAQAAAMARLDTLLGDIERVAAERMASRSDEDRQWGSLLEAIQRQPAGVSLEERLFVAGDQPVLVQWGCRDDDTVSTKELLRDTRAAVAPPISPVARRSDPGGGATVLSAGPAVIERGPGGAGWLLAALLWLLFVLVLAAILYWLLAACALRLPPQFQIVGACPGSTSVAPELARHDALEAELRRIRGGIETARQCRIDGPAGGGPWAMADPPPAVPAPQPAPDAALGDTDIDRARDEAGGGLGDVTVTLLWNGRSDLDLVIRCPNGTSFTAADGQGDYCGEIDVDANYCSSVPSRGAPCRTYAGGAVANPVENAVFESGSAPGRVTAAVRHYAAAEGGPVAPVPFVLQIRRGESRERHTGVATPGETRDVANFMID